MTAQARPMPEPRQPLSRERVLEAAIGLADAAGIESLSMRKLARELGVEAMSLYHYTRSKDEILDGMLEMAVSEIEIPGGGPDWKASIRQSAITFHDVLLRHPWAASLLMSAPRVSQGRLRYMDALLGTLREAGFSAAETDHAYHALDSHILGFALWAAGMSQGLAQLGSLEDFLQSLALAGYPYVEEHAQQHLKPRALDDEGAFAFGLDLILDGLERMLNSRA